MRSAQSIRSICIVCEAGRLLFLPMKAESIWKELEHASREARRDTRPKKSARVRPPRAYQIQDEKRRLKSFCQEYRTGEKN